MISSSRRVMGSLLNTHSRGRAGPRSRLSVWPGRAGLICPRHILLQNADFRIRIKIHLLLLHHPHCAIGLSVRVIGWSVGTRLGVAASWRACRLLQSNHGSEESGVSLQQVIWTPSQLAGSFSIMHRHLHSETQCRASHYWASTGSGPSPDHTQDRYQLLGHPYPRRMRC